MGEPDEALKWARKQALKTARPYYRDPILLGQMDHTFGIYELAEGFRAGQAASAESIKALEGALRPLAECVIIGSDSGSRRAWNPDDHGARYFITYGEIRRARALIKEADQ